MGFCHRLSHPHHTQFRCKFLSAIKCACSHKIGMDKYLLKKPRQKAEKHVVASTSRPMKQSTIHSLKGVVVVEDIEHHKSKLCLPGQSPDVLVASLKQLNKKIPPRHILLSTKIGNLVNKLRKHPDSAVATEARRVYIKWKSFYKEKIDKPQIEVKCDLKTEAARLKAKTLLCQALGVDVCSAIIEGIEREAFFCHKRLLSPGYKRTIRVMVFKLRNSEEVKTDLVGGKLSIEEFVKQHKKS